MYSSHTGVRFIIFDAAKDAEGVRSLWRELMGTEPDVVTDVPSFTHALKSIQPHDALAVMTHGNAYGAPRFSSGGRRAERVEWDELPLTQCRTLYLFSCYQVTIPRLFIAEGGLHCVALARTKTIERIIRTMADAPDVHDPEAIRARVKWMPDHWVVHPKAETSSDST